MVPVNLKVADDCTRILNLEGFTSPEYVLGPRLATRTHDIGSDPDRKFPTLSVTMTVYRRPMYFVQNAFLPSLLFSPTDPRSCSRVAHRAPGPRSR